MRKCECWWKSEKINKMAYGEISDIYGDIVLSAAIMDNQQGNSE